MQKLFIRAITGVGIGLAVLVVYALLLNSFRGSPLRDAASKPFFAFSQPALALGEHIFGQAPIPILFLLGLYWSLAGLLGSLIIHLVCFGLGRAGSRFLPANRADPRKTNDASRRKVSAQHCIHYRT